MSRRSSRCRGHHVEPSVNDPGMSDSNCNQLPCDCTSQRVRKPTSVISNPAHFVAMAGKPVPSIQSAGPGVAVQVGGTARIELALHPGSHQSGYAVAITKLLRSAYHHVVGWRFNGEPL